MVLSKISLDSWECLLKRQPICTISVPRRLLCFEFQIIPNECIWPGSRYDVVHDTNVIGPNYIGHISIYISHSIYSDILVWCTRYTSMKYQYRLRESHNF